MNEEFVLEEGYREVVDFKEVIGTYVSPSTSIELETTMGVIQYLNDRKAYIIPSVPKEVPFAKIVAKNEEIARRCEILLSILKSLLDEVSAHLRAVFADWTVSTDRLSIKLYFVFDKEITDNDKDDGESVAGEVVANFVNAVIEAEFVHINYPEPIPRFGKELVYKRKE